MSTAQMRLTNAKALKAVRQYNNRQGKKPVMIVTTPRNQPTAKAVNRKVKRIQRREELKHKDTLISGISMASDAGTTQIILLNGLSQGNTDITRVADKVAYTSIQVRANIFTISANVAPSFWRVLIVRDMQPNGAAPVATNVLDTSVVTSYVFAPYNQDYMERFRIISDKSGTLVPRRNQQTTIVGGVTTTDTVGVVEIKYRVKRQLSFQSNYGLGNAGTIADISKNSVYILLLSEYAAASGLAPFFTGGVRMYYKDD